MPIRLTGMASGLDTEALVSELVSAYRKKSDKYFKAQSKLTWKQDAWKTMSSKTYSFRTKLDSLRFSSAYNLKTTSVSNSTKASVTASNRAVNGSQSLQITSLAKSGYLTGKKLELPSGEDVTQNTTLVDLGYNDKNGDGKTVEGKILLNGKEIVIDDGVKSIKDIINKFNDAGVNASYDSVNKRVFISAKESGKKGDFTLSALNEAGASALKALGVYTKSDTSETLQSQYKKLYEEFGLTVDQPMDPAKLKSALQKYNQSKETIATADQNTLETELEAAKEYVNYHSLLEDYAKQYAAADADGTKTQAERDDLKETIVDQLGNNIEYVVKNQDTDYSEGAVRINGTDASIELNGVQFTSASNTFNINGLTINALATTDAAITITTTTDNQGIYDKIKDFLSEYNSLIKSMTASYNAASASEYEPLTDEEKEAMTESQIEKWEQKGKGSVLRRDSTLSALMSTLTNAMAKSYSINGKNYSLSSFGIKTLGILNAEQYEQNNYHIDGDADDDNTSGNADKLMAAISQDPETVMTFFQKLSSDVYDGLTKKMSSTSMRTYGTFYNDKEMAKEYSDYTTTISKWEQKVQDIENSYYKKFAAMEKALTEMQSKQSQLSGLLG